MKIQKMRFESGPIHVTSENRKEKSSISCNFIQLFIPLCHEEDSRV